MVIKACIVGNSVRNTGKECDISMGPTAMLLPVPASLTFTIRELQNILEWAFPLMHASPAQRIYPLFGQKAPINTITNNSEADVDVTLDDGTRVFLRYGIYNRIYETIAGGLCYAGELASFLKSGMNIIEVDQSGQILICNTGLRNDAGEKLYRGLIPNFMYAPSPILADLKTTPYKNRFAYSFNPTEMVNNGEIFTGGAPLLALMGLINTEIVSAGAATTTTPAVRASGTVTITAVGGNGDTLDVKYSGVSISGGPVTKTASESTVTLLAAKIAAAITSADNGGFTATNAAGVITIVAPANYGATTVVPSVTIVGTATATTAAFAGGTTAVAKLLIGIQTECAESDLVPQFGTDFAADPLNFVVTDKVTGAVITTTAALVSGHIELTGNFVSGRTYTVVGAAPLVWYDNDISGYDASGNGIDILIP